MTTSSQRPIRVAELLSVGSELTVGETRDTNSGELARELTKRGVKIARIQTLPDDLATVRDAVRAALDEADVVISTGGLGPTPDDLTREAIAAVLGQTPEVVPELEAWLRGLWERRGMPFATVNLKQAWLIPAATAIPNPNGTAPGWWVDAPDGRVIVAMPGPPREMRPMWSDWVVPRLVERGLGADIVIRTLRLTGIGESQLAEQLGDALLRATNPNVATYARHDSVDVRISAIADVASPSGSGRSAAELADEVEAAVMAVVAPFVWARGETTWAMALDAELERLGWTLGIAEAGTRGALAALLADMDRLVLAEARYGDGGPATDERATPRAAAADRARPAPEPESEPDAPPHLARMLRDRFGVDVGLAVLVTDRGEDSAVDIAIDSPSGADHEQRLAFLRGTMGRNRAAITAAALLLQRLRGTLDAPRRLG